MILFVDRLGWISNLERMKFGKNEILLILDLESNFVHEIIVLVWLNPAYMYMLDIQKVQLRMRETKYLIFLSFLFSNLPGIIFSVVLCSFLNVGKSRNEVCVIAVNGVTTVKFVGST